MLHIREVGPRDGLQAEAPIAVADRARLIDALSATGLREIEVVSFVSPKAVPSMASPHEVLSLMTPVEGVAYWALVPNVRGAELAMQSPVPLAGLTFTASASAVYNEKNVRMTIEESIATLAAVRAVVGAPVVIDAVISCAFGSPYEGDIRPSRVGRLGEQLLDAGATTLTVADTTGMATPRRIRDLYEDIGPAVGLHLHETRGTALVNAYEAMSLGVRRFDCSIGGLGGSPFADGAGGNLATEDLVHLCDDLGVETGVSLDALLSASSLVASLIGHPVPSKVASAGPRWKLA